jgi:rhomboid protease GluP
MPPRDAPARPPRRPFGEVARGAPVTVALFAACIIVFLIAWKVEGSTTTTAALIHFGALHRSLVWAGQYWRLVTYMFMHIGPLHIICNVYFGFRICEIAERQLGSWRFLWLYLGSGIVGGAASVIGHDALSAGASGALFGVVGWMLVTLRLRAGSLRAFVQNTAIRQQLIWIVAWFVLGIYAGFDNYAHGGGLLFGGLYTWALAAGPAEPRKRRVRLAIALGVGVVLVAGSLHPLPFQHQLPTPTAGDSDGV